MRGAMRGKRVTMDFETDEFVETADNKTWRMIVRARELTRETKNSVRETKNFSCEMP